jgi:hypothetical protein
VSDEPREWTKDEVREQVLAKVWQYVVQHGDQEDCHVWGVYASLERAVAGIKATFPVPPYAVEWGSVEQRRPGYWELTGQFSRVEGYCCAGPDCWAITEYPVKGVAEAPG